MLAKFMARYPDERYGEATNRRVDVVGEGWMWRFASGRARLRIAIW